MVHDYSYDKPTLVMATKGTIESEKFNILFKNMIIIKHICIHVLV